MATETVHAVNAEARLHAVGELCQGIAMKLHSAKELLGNDCNEDLNSVVAAMLGQLGWMAEKASLIAGDQVPIVGSPEGWMLDSGVQAALQGRGQ